MRLFFLFSVSCQLLIVSLQFGVGDNEVHEFRMIERHYFRGKVSDVDGGGVTLCSSPACLPASPCDAAPFFLSFFL
jgi:hypothetical protein